MDSSSNSKPQAKPRISLTKAQLEAPAALDLLAMLQTITSDGKVLESEIHSLREWLHNQRGSEIPAIQHLIGVVEMVLQDGRITDQEREWLQKSIETVLPREQREIAILRRRERTADEKKEKAEEKRKSTPIADFDFMVAGVFYEGRQSVVSRFVKVGDIVFLLRDLKNKYSRNAVEIRLSNGLQIGYVPEKDAVWIAPILDKDGCHSATIKKILDGRRGPIPVVWGELYPTDCSLPDVVSQSAAFEKCKRSEPTAQTLKPSEAKPLVQAMIQSNLAAPIAAKKANSASDGRKKSCTLLALPIMIVIMIAIYLFFVIGWCSR
jgi:hypothetical protein